MAEGRELPGGPNTQGTVEEAHIEVGLHGVGNTRRVVEAELPNRVDLGEGAEQGNHATDHEQETRRLGHEDREHGRTHDIVLRPSLTGELRVLLANQQEQVRAHETQQHQRNDQHVNDEEARDDGRAGKVATKEKEGNVGTDDRERQDDGVRDTDTSTRHQVVGERVAEEAFRNRQDQQRRTDGPVQLTRLAECSREEDTTHVHHDGAHEDVAGPVVHLTHQQTAADGEGQVDRRGVGLGHLLTHERQVGAVVGRDGRRGHVVEGQENTGNEQYHEGVQRNFTEHEGPVVREDLVEERTATLGHAKSVVELVENLADLAVGTGGLALGALRFYLCTHE